MKKIIFKDEKGEQSFIVRSKEYNKIYNIVAPKKDIEKGFAYCRKCGIKIKSTKSNNYDLCSGCQEEILKNDLFEILKYDINRQIKDKGYERALALLNDIIDRYFNDEYFEEDILEDEDYNEVKNANRR